MDGWGGDGWRQRLIGGAVARGLALGSLVVVVVVVEVGGGGVVFFVNAPSGLGVRRTVLALLVAVVVVCYNSAPCPQQVHVSARLNTSPASSRHAADQHQACRSSPRPTRDTSSQFRDRGKSGARTLMTCAVRFRGIVENSSRKAGRSPRCRPFSTEKQRTPSGMYRSAFPGSALSHTCRRSIASFAAESAAPRT